LVVALFDRLTHSKLPFCLQRKPPEILIEDVDRNAALGGVKRRAPITGLEVRSADLLKKEDVISPKPPALASTPAKVRSGERLIAEE